MESIHSPKKPGAARSGVLAFVLPCVLLLALPCAWYAAYHDQLATSAARSVPFGAAPPPRPSGVISLAPPAPGKTRTVQIQHTGGQVVTTVNDGNVTITARTTDPHPPSNPLDALGQSLCDHYNAWKTERGDPHQPANVIVSGGGTITFQLLPPPNPTVGTAAVTPAVSAPAPPPAHVPGTRAPGSTLRPAAHTSARL